MFTVFQVHYKKGYKYQLVEPLLLNVSSQGIVGFSAETDWITLDPYGMLLLKKGYASDGPSGPSIDTKSFMRGAFGHDALYQLIREGYIPITYRKNADMFLYYTCISDGMLVARAMYVYSAVRLFGEPNCISGNERKVIIAP